MFLFKTSYLNKVGYNKAEKEYERNFNDGVALSANVRTSEM